MTDATPARQPISWHRIWLIARREIRERMAQKVFRVVLVVGALFVAGIVVVPTLFEGDDDGPTETTVPVAFVSGPPAEANARARQLERAAVAAGSTPIRVRVVRPEVARAAVRDGDDSIALLIAGPVEQPTITVLQRTNVLVDASDAVTAVQRSATEARLRGLHAGERRRALAPVAVQTQQVESTGSTPAAAAIVGVMTLVLYLIGLLLNTAFANGVVSDRSGRIVERLLTAARPEEHLLGKLLGVGAAGLIQFAAWIAAGVLAGLLVAGELRDTFEGVPALLLIWFPISVVLTYVLYAALAAVFVIPVRRIEDVAGALAIGSMFQIVAYIAATTILPPGSTVGPTVQALSLVPFFSPLVMLPRIAAGDVAAWELAVGGLGPLLLAALLIRLAAPAYARHAIDAPGGKGLGAALKALRR
jgi:ABC-2 type transport system permease protein